MCESDLGREHSRAFNGDPRPAAWLQFLHQHLGTALVVIKRLTFYGQIL